MGDLTPIAALLPRREVLERRYTHPLYEAVVTTYTLSMTSVTRLRWRDEEEPGEILYDGRDLFAAHEALFEFFPEIGESLLDAFLGNL